jgi:predicted dehydrogenase
MKTAVIGSGFMGRVHAEALRRLGNVEVVAVGGRDEPGLRIALADPSIHAVHICTPNSVHFEMAKAALEAGKHVLCEKPLAVSSEEGAALVELARDKKLRNCTCHNLRYYPMVQQMRRMREAGDLGEILVAQGTYSQDWLLYDTDWNWRIEAEAGGPSRVMADIGSHWCDMAEHITGLRITHLCADLQTFHKTRKRPKASIETFAGKTLTPSEYDEVPIFTEDFGAVVFRMGDGVGEKTRGAFTASQVSAGRKNRLSIEIYGSKSSVAWDQGGRTSCGSAIATPIIK